MAIGQEASVALSYAERLRIAAGGNGSRTRQALGPMLLGDSEELEQQPDLLVF